MQCSFKLHNVAEKMSTIRSRSMAYNGGCGRYYRMLNLCPCDYAIWSCRGKCS